MHTEVFVTRQLLQNGVGNPSNAHLQRGVVGNQLRYMASDGIRDGIAGKRNRTVQRLIPDDAIGDGALVDQRISESAGNVSIDLRYHDVRLGDRRQSRLQCRSETDKPMPVRRTHVNQGHDRSKVRLLQEPRHLGQK